MRHPWRPAATAAAVLVATALLVTAAAAVVGVRVVPVLTGSMRPAIAPGALVVTTPVDPDDVRVGQVVAFRPPAPYLSGAHPVLHRVRAVADARGTPVLTTGGDANPATDPWRIDLSSADLTRTRLVVPVLGWALMGGPAPLLAVLAGAFLLLEATSLTRRRRCTCPAVPPPGGPAGTPAPC